MVDRPFAVGEGSVTVEDSKLISNRFLDLPGEDVREVVERVVKKQAS